jgi:hypothetical protein
MDESERKWWLTVDRNYGQAVRVHRTEEAAQSTDPLFEAVEVVPALQLRWAVHSYEELRGWVTEALNLPGQPSGEARRALLNGLNGTTRTEDKP